MRVRLKQELSKFLKVGLAVGLIVWIIRRGALDLQVLKSLADPLFIALLVALVFGSIFLNNIRWMLLLRSQGFKTTVRTTLPLSLIGMFFNFAMPGGVGGDVVKGYYLLQNHQDQRTAAAVSVLMDRMLGFFVMISMAVAALAMNRSVLERSSEVQTLAVALMLVFFSFVAVFLASFSRRLNARFVSRFLRALPGGRALGRVYSSVHEYSRSVGTLAMGFVISLFSQSCIVLFVAFVGWKMGETAVPLAGYFLLVPVGVVLMALPLSPGGIGVGQAAFFFLFKVYLGKDTQVGPTAVTLFQMVQFFWGLFGAWFYLRRKKPVIREVST